MRLVKNTRIFLSEKNQYVLSIKIGLIFISHYFHFLKPDHFVKNNNKIPLRDLFLRMKEIFLELKKTHIIFCKAVITCQSKIISHSGSGSEKLFCC